MGVSRGLTIASTAIVMCVGIALIGGGAWLATRGGGVECIKYFQFPIFAVGAVLFLVGLLGFLGACLEVVILLYVYLLATFCAIIALGVFTALAFVATNKAVQPVSGVGFATYRVPDFSNWMQSFVSDPQQWQKLSSCIRDSNVCHISISNVTTPYNLYDVNLTPVQAGCCTRPVFCNNPAAAPAAAPIGLRAATVGGLASALLNQTTGTSVSDMVPFLSPPGAPPSNSSADCTLYSPDVAGLCYPCDTCKAGLLKAVQDGWRTVAYVNLSLLAVLLVVYVVGCCAMRSARRNGLFKGIV